MRVWVDDWQMQCCGGSFRVASTVSWTLEPADAEDYSMLLGEDLAATVTHHEEHHGGLPDDAPVTTGLVTGIHAVFCEYGSRAGAATNTPLPLPETRLLREVAFADGWDKDVGRARLVGYLVDLEP